MAIFSEEHFRLGYAKMGGFSPPQGSHRVPVLVPLGRGVRPRWRLSYRAAPSTEVTDGREAPKKLIDRDALPIGVFGGARPAA